MNADVGKHSNMVDKTRRPFCEPMFGKESLASLILDDPVVKEPTWGTGEQTKRWWYQIHGEQRHGSRARGGAAPDISAG